MNKNYGWKVSFSVAMVLVFCMAPLSHALIITPGNSIWKSDLQGNGNASILADNPRSGDASLALQTTGSLSDWAFYTRYAGNDITTASWGKLSDVGSLSFDWYRKQVAIQPQYQNDVPWLAQTPVLNLYVRDVQNGSNVFSRLVWEKFYTDNSPAVTDTWVTQDVSTQNLWRYVDDAGYTVTDGSNKNPFFPDSLLATSLESWLSHYSSQAVVYGIGVGAGSFWPDQYVGYVDNVVLGFRGQDDLSVNDNFELINGENGGPSEVAVPEPSSLALMTGGGLLIVIGVFLRRWKKVDNCC